MGLLKFSELVEGVDYYREGERVVFTSIYHLKRGSCCHSKCRHCPYRDNSTPETFTLPIRGLPIVIPGIPTKGNPDGGQSGSSGA
jgi:hypothetical protein